MLPNEMLEAYFDRLVGKIYKVLPLKESDGDTVKQYLDGLLTELLGIQSVADLSGQTYYVSVVGIVSYLAEHISECEQAKVRREVFQAIGLCKKLRNIYGGGDTE